MERESEEGRNEGRKIERVVVFDVSSAEYFM